MNYEEMKAQADEDRKMHQWWTLISEKERAAIVDGIRGCTEYGLTVTVQRMPDAGKDAVCTAYAQHVKHVAELEAAHPAD